MCPIMTPAAIREYSPVFDASISNWGLDSYWSYYEWKAGFGVAVLDSTPIRHCRPVGGGVAYEGLAAEDERVAFFEKYKVPFYSFLCLDGIVNPKLLQNPERLNDIVRLGLNLSGYPEQLLQDSRFLASYVKREIAAMHHSKEYLKGAPMLTQSRKS
jgi:hypothetical protein